MTAQRTALALALALIIGGPAAGGCVAVEVVAGHLPLYLGLHGGNYVLDRSSLSEDLPAAYLHWPLDAPEPIERGHDLQ
jgi:hypothetical protein